MKDSEHLPKCGLRCAIHLNKIKNEKYFGYGTTFNFVNSEVGDTSESSID